MFNNKNRLSQAIFAVIASSSMAPAVMAQTEQQNQPTVVEEVLVTGIRASLERAMDVKRESAGVVDAISAEDIGKFPDSNLSESLQRITGVSIDRVNGEGSSVTIRGFGGGNNLVLLNGRHMPAASAYGGNSGGGGTRNFGSRSFDFANLASESVRALQVYKTGRAGIPTGGIGGTINIETTRPLEDPGTHVSVGAKAVHDTSVVNGNDITPELSGLFSWSNDDDTIGVSLSASYQERDSAAPGAALDNWNIGVWDEDNWQSNNLYSWDVNDDGEFAADVDNLPADGQLYARPNDVRYSFSERSRERTNAQLTVQYRPIETVTLTADYTFAENYLQEHRGEQTFWFANSSTASRVVFDDSAVATPIIYEEAALSNKDMGYEQQWREQENTLESFGFNVEFAVNDSLTLTFDAHDSSMESLPVGPAGAGSVDISIAAPVGTGQFANFSGDIPNVTFTFDDAPGNNNDQFDAGDFGTQIGRIWYASQITDITQVSLAGALEFDNGRFDFGVSSRALEVDTKQSNNQMTFGDWGVSNPGELSDGMLEEFSFPAHFDDFNLSGHTPYGIRATDPIALMQEGIDLYVTEGDGETEGNGYAFQINPAFDPNRLLEEDSVALFAEVSIDGQVGPFETNLLAGLRYETTDVKSTTMVDFNVARVWADNNDFTTVNSDPSTFLPAVGEFDYDNLLPAIDFSVNFTDDIKARASFSKTIARPSYGDLALGYSNFNQQGSTYLGSQLPTAQESRPDLLPLESDNVDLSVEWYYDDSSYASVGLFEKRVANFIGTSQVEKVIDDCSAANPDVCYNLRDQTGGPRVEEAAAALQERGIAVSDTSLWVMTKVLENPGIWAGGADDVEVDENNPTLISNEFHLEAVAEGPISQNPEDPETVWRVATPSNNREAKLYGAELALQHFFGDTGFGVQANYTIVRGDVSFDDLADPSRQQFALLGLSDTANLVAIYEKDGLSARLAYNWRDKFLNETNRGSGNNPTYVEAYNQLDLNVSYDINDQFSVFFEGINLTEEDVRHHGRNESMLWYLQDLGARYNLGVRYTL